jgi:ABC-type transport system substrate-binding protein
MIANRLYDTSTIINPYTHASMPWVVCEWMLEEWISEDPYIPNGMILKLYLRNDVTWHDGDPVSAHDIKWNFDFIEATQSPEFVAIWDPYIKSEIVHDYLLEVYINATGGWVASDFMGNILIFPEVIWAPFYGDDAAARAFMPWAVTYDAHVGSPPPSGLALTCLIGTGPFYLDYWDEVSIAHLIKNPNYWVQVAGEPSGQIPELHVHCQCWVEHEGEIIPYITHASPIHTFVNLKKFETCVFEYYTTANDVVVIGPNGKTLPAYAHSQEAPIPNFAILNTPGVYTWELYVNAAGPKYTITAAYLPGDLNCDFLVDIFDALQQRVAMGSPPLRNYDPKSDLDYDGDVDIFDALILAFWFGESYP